MTDEQAQAMLQKILAEWKQKIKAYDKDGGFIVYVEDYDNDDFDVELMEKFLIEKLEYVSSVAYKAGIKQMAMNFISFATDDPKKKEELNKMIQKQYAKTDN